MITSQVAPGSDTLTAHSPIHSARHLVSLLGAEVDKSGESSGGEWRTEEGGIMLRESLRVANGTTLCN